MKMTIRVKMGIEVHIYGLGVYKDDAQGRRPEKTPLSPLCQGGIRTIEGMLHVSCSISHPVGKHIPVSKHDNEMRAYCVRISYRSE